MEFNLYLSPRLPPPTPLNDKCGTIFQTTPLLPWTTIDHHQKWGVFSVAMLYHLFVDVLCFLWCSSVKWEWVCFFLISNTSFNRALGVMDEEYEFVDYINDEDEGVRCIGWKVMDENVFFKKWRCWLAKKHYGNFFRD